MRPDSKFLLFSAIATVSSVINILLIIFWLLITKSVALWISNIGVMIFSAFLHLYLAFTDVHETWEMGQYLLFVLVRIAMIIIFILEAPRRKTIKGKILVFFVILCTFTISLFFHLKSMVEITSIVSQIDRSNILEPV